MHWFEAVEIVTPYVVRITTPQGSGTGFLVAHSSNAPMIGLATAAHVVDHAHYWEQPIRIQRAETQESVLLRGPDRAIVLDEQRDTALIVLSQRKELSFPGSPPPLIQQGYNLKIGNSIGWLGYPAIGGTHLCFFTGTVSAWGQASSGYFVDGVAINGVSGGPAFSAYLDRLEIIGVVSAYMPNRVTGETLPGLGIVRDVYQFQDFTRYLKTMEEAKAQETPPSRFSATSCSRRRTSYARCRAPSDLTPSRGDERAGQQVAFCNGRVLQA